MSDYLKDLLHSNGISITDLMLPENREMYRSRIPLSLNTFKTIWRQNEDTKMLKLREPSSNVCDVCWLFKYVVRLSDDAELVARVSEKNEHMERANEMKKMYHDDCQAAKAGLIGAFVAALDYSQNLPLSSPSRVPSKFYFLLFITSTVLVS